MILPVRRTDMKISVMQASNGWIQSV